MTRQPITDNTLFYGDNLKILREYIPDASVDLVYLDPPFNSNRSYNVLFKDESGSAAEAQIVAFDDTWHWGDAAAEAYEELVTDGRPEVGRLIAALREFIGANQMLAYLVMMAIRLVELHRVLKPTGSLYLHCDPTASHYLKIILDTIFGPEHFRTEIAWKRSTAHSDTAQGRKQHGRIHDVILYYTKGADWTWSPLYTPYDSGYVDDFYRHVEPGTGRRYRLGDITGPGGAAKGNPQYEVMGVTRYWRYSREKMQELIAQGRIVQTKPGAVPAYKRYLDEMPGVPLQDIWDDIGPIAAQAAERLGYPTQKPLALLERIIQASSNPGDLVLDPFCGCGTAIAAAQKLGRTWVGIDVTHLAIALQKYRLAAMFPGLKFRVIGEPEDLGAARQLAHDDRYQFQWWALSLIRARPLGGDGGKTGKKGADKGVDGLITFIDDASGKPKEIVVQVKSGHVNAGTVRDLVGTLNQERAAMGVLVTLEPATRDMEGAAATAGFYESVGWGQKYRRVQILTVEQLLAGAQVQMPPTAQTFKRAAKTGASAEGQLRLTREE